MTPLPENMTETPAFAVVTDELGEALSLYWSTAGRILRGSGVRLLSPPAGYDALERNFFSALFLYSYHRAGIEPARRVCYAAINQCLRGMVTGCDNLLDDEYKKTLETDLPETGVRFRSVLDMLTSDRILFDILFHAFQRGEISAPAVLDASAMSLQALTRSGAQEAAEEEGVRQILSPEAVLQSVHHYKTGLLFQAPWAIPTAVERPATERAEPMRTALYDIGMGCQIMDDMVDLAADLEKKRHNYLLSLIRHDADSGVWQTLIQWQADSAEQSAVHPLDLFPEIRDAACRTSREYLIRGLCRLFAPEHQAFVPAAMQFLSRRIGADRFLMELSDEKQTDFLG